MFPAALARQKRGAMTDQQPRKQTRPSYEEGKVRDSRIEDMQREGVEAEEFTGLVRRAATFRVTPKPAITSVQPKQRGA